MCFMTNKPFSFLSFISIFTICFMIQSCKKQDLPRQYIVGNWKMTGYIYDGKDLFPTLPGCGTDNIITFTSDQKFIIDEGPTKCYSSDLQTFSGTYSVSNDEKTLTLSLDFTNLIVTDIQDS